MGRSHSGAAVHDDLPILPCPPHRLETLAQRRWRQEAALLIEIPWVREVHGTGHVTRTRIHRLRLAPVAGGRSGIDDERRLDSIG